METYILEHEYVGPTRPYSQHELMFNREKLHRNFRLSNLKVEHEKCNHSYRVRTNGRKEQEMLETDNKDVGNCSVCWKLNKTPLHLRDRAFDLIEQYTQNFDEDPSSLTYDLVSIEKFYYTWLYNRKGRQYNNNFNNFHSSAK